MNDNINTKKEIPESIIEGISTLLKKDRQEAIEKFISEGYDAKLLNEYIFTKNTYLFSSFVQISSRGNDDSKINFWKQFEQYCMRFYKHKSDPDYNFDHILNSVNKYFINDEDIWIFIEHIKDLNHRVIDIKKSILLPFYYNREEQPDIILRLVRRANEELYEPIEEDINTLTLEDINKISNVSSYRFYSALLEFSENKNLDILDYSVLLRGMFYSICHNINDYKLLNYLLEEGNIENLIGIYKWDLEYIKERAYNKICLLDPNAYFQAKINEINLSDNIFNKIESFDQLASFNRNNDLGKENLIKNVYPILSRDFYLILAETDDYERKRELIDRYYEAVKLSINFWCRSVHTFLLECETINKFEYVISIMEEIENLYIKNDLKWQDLYIDLIIYLVFEQDDVDLSEGHGISHPNFVCELTTSQKNRFYNILDKQLNKLSSNLGIEGLSDLERRRYYTCLGLMLINGNLKAFYIAKDLYELSKTSEEYSPYRGYFEYHLMRFVDSRGIEHVFAKKSFKIGLEWEKICNRIAVSKYGKILSEFHNQTRLLNNSIPDIIVDRNVQYKNNRVERSEIIIECKSSMYFIENIYDIVNNNTTSIYLPFCDQLQYWILQEFEYFNPDLQHERVRFFFAKDFLEDPNISNDIKEDIEKLLDTRATIPTAFSNLSIEELFEYIDFYISDKEIG